MFVVQIGAYDGVSDVHRDMDTVYDLITKRGWQGTLIEPNPEAFAQLKQNYAGYNNVKLLQLAVAHWTGTATFFVCENMAQASSLDRTILSRNNYHDGKTIKQKEISVTCVTIDSILQNSSVPDYLVVDAEGYDGIILMDLDLNKYPIPKIRFEFTHIYFDQLGKVCLKLLKAGYVLEHDKADIVATKKGVKL